MNTRPQIQRHRPYDPEAMKALCERMASGETLTSMCPVDGLHRTTVLAWVAAIPAAADEYARAREWQAEAHADAITAAASELLEAARSGGITGEQVQAYRASVDAMKWQASKLRPKVYGERLDIALEQATTLVLLDYGRSERLKPEGPKTIEAEVVRSLTSGEPTLVTPKAKVPKRHRLKSMSAKRRAKYLANRAKMEAARAALKAKPKRGATKRGRG